MTMAKKCVLRKSFWLTLILGIFFISGISYANKHTFKYGIYLKGGYSDNISFERTNPKEDTHYDAEPYFTYEYQAERFLLNTKASLNFLRYTEEREEDRENYDCGLSIQQKIMERLTFDGDISFKRDTTQESELLETGVVTSRQNRDQYVGSGRISFRMSELTSLGVNYQFVKKEFERKTSVDYSQHLASLSFSRFLNNGLDILSVVPTYDYRDSNLSIINNYSLSLRWRHEFNETFSSSISAGGRYTEQEFYDDRDDGEKADNTGYIADINLRKESKQTSVQLGYKRDISTSVYGTESELDNFYLYLSKKIGERLRMAVEGRYYLRNEIADFYLIDTEFYQVSPTLTYRITEKHLLEVGYSYASMEDKAIPDEDSVERNRVWLVLRFNYDNIW